MAIDWHTLAKDRGHETPKSLLADMYWGDKMTIDKIAKVLFTSTWAVASAMRRFKVPTRPQGGRRGHN